MGSVLSWIISSRDVHQHFSPEKRKKGEEKRRSKLLEEIRKEVFKEHVDVRGRYEEENHIIRDYPSRAD